MTYSQRGDNLLENFISELHPIIGCEVEHNVGKYVSRNHNCGNLILPRCHTKDNSKLDEISKQNYCMKFLIDEIRTVPESNHYQVFMNQNSVFRPSLQTVFHYAEKFGTSSLHGPKLKLADTDQEFLESDPLSSHRLYLCFVVLQKFLHFRDSAVSEKEESPVSTNPSCNSKYILISDHKMRRGNSDETIHVSCRTEINELNGSKNIDLSYKDYRLLREKDVQRSGELKGSNSSKVSKIVKACIVFDLLTNKFSMPVYLNLSSNRIMSRNSSSKGAISVLYTCARISTILEKFEEFIRETQIEVPSIEEMDFSLLNIHEEKIILYNYVLTFPIVMKEIWTELCDNREFLIHKLCLFLAQFSSVVSKYYRSTRVLMTQTPNLFPLMFARIYLLRASLQVFLNGLQCLDIEPLTEM